MCPDQPPKKDSWENIYWKAHHYNERAVLKSGSFLNSFCPHCKQSVVQDHMVHLETVAENGETGWVEFSPFLNVFERRSDIHLPDGKEVADLRCCNCHASLKVEGMQCERGDSHVACLMVAISSIRVPFYFCMREGCHWHCIDPDDQHKIILDDSMEW